MGLDISKINPVKDKYESKNFLQSLMGLLNKDISISRNKIDDKQKELLYAKLALLFRSGVDIKTALDLCEKDFKKPKQKIIISEIKNRIVRGDSIAISFEKSNHFTPYEIYSIRIGEESGKLVIVLENLTQYFKVKIQQRRKVISAVSYPFVILLTAMWAVGFMLRFLVPMFADVYKRFGGELPFITQLVLDLSEFLKNYSLFILLSLVATFYLLFVNRKKDWFRKYTAMALMKIPVLNDLIRKIYLSRFCSSMSLLISANVPLVESLKMIKQMISFYPIEETIDSINDKIYQGAFLYECMSTFPVYPEDMIYLIKVGEEVNGLDKMFERIQQQYSEEILYQMELVNSLLEPILIVFIGIIIGFILVAMYLPIFKLSSQMM